ncbi:TPA: hypothetical protein DF272_00865 [Candidatus Falkowbacteria bacterium]|nr:hypothetical protein [Candidatus Falkowbacteria bacterium]
MNNIFGKLFGPRPTKTVPDPDRPKPQPRPTEIEPTWPEMSLARFESDVLQSFPSEIIASVGQLLDAERAESGSFYFMLPKYYSKISSVADDIRKTCLTYHCTPPKNLPESYQRRVDILGRLITELRQALDERRELKKIYQILKRFHTEGGAPQAWIMPEFED